MAICNYYDSLAEEALGISFNEIVASEARAIMQATGLHITRRNGGVQCLDAKLERF